MISCAPGVLTAPVTAVQNITNFYCELWSGTILPINATISGQGPVPPSAGQYDSNLMANISITSLCGELFIAGFQCQDNVNDILLDCVNGGADTFGGSNLVVGCEHYTVKLLDAA